MVTLGISTNTRLLGLAVLKEGRLLDFSIRLHKSPWSPSKANVILSSLEPYVREYPIKKIVVAIPHDHYQTEAFQYLILRIQEYCAQHNIPIGAETAEAIYTICPPEQKKTKKHLMYALTLQYPQLTYCYHKELRNKTKYYIKLFEAVAVVTLNP